VGGVRTGIEHERHAVVVFVVGHDPGSFLTLWALGSSCDRRLLGRCLRTPAAGHQQPPPRDAAVALAREHTGATGSVPPNGGAVPSRGAVKLAGLLRPITPLCPNVWPDPVRGHRRSACTTIWLIAGSSCMP